MKIVVKTINEDNHDFLIYLKTDDDVAISAEFATMDTYEYVIEDLIDESGEEEENVPIFTDVAPPTEPMPNNLPLILVMYMDRELMKNSAIMGPFSDSINDTLAAREANAMAFFVPTDGEERIECINPLIATEIEKDRIGKLINDISTSFDINKKDEN